MTYPIPPSEAQVSTVDSDGCVSFATTHLIESQRILHGDNTEYSERFLTKISGTTNQGNRVVKVFETVKNIGMVPESLWPETFPFTWGEFYADIPQNVIDAGKDFLSKYDISEPEYNIPIANLSLALQKGPVLAILQGPGLNHAVVFLDNDLIIDSYPHHHDTNGVIDYTEKYSELQARGVNIESLHQLLITPKNMPNQAKVVKSKLSPTIYVCYPMPTEPYLRQKADLEGFLVPTDLTIVPDSDALA